MNEERKKNMFCFVCFFVRTKTKLQNNLQWTKMVALIDRARSQLFHPGLCHATSFLYNLIYVFCLHYAICLIAVNRFRHLVLPFLCYPFLLSLNASKILVLFIFKQLNSLIYDSILVIVIWVLKIIINSTKVCFQTGGFVLVCLWFLEVNLWLENYPEHSFGFGASDCEHRVQREVISNNKRRRY